MSAHPQHHPVRAAWLRCLYRDLRAANHWLHRHWLKLAWLAVIALAIWVVPLRAMELIQQHQATAHPVTSAVRG